ncbi:MAG: hypothetical protein NTZ99_01165 [Burkholderiales bacterium]|nr:hypothetical protein [Burkholderiales bacterium]
MEKLIQTQNLCKEYQMGDTLVHALRNVSIDINEGEFGVHRGQVNRPS